MPEVVPPEYSQTPPTATYFHFRFPVWRQPNFATVNINYKLSL